MTGPGHYAEAQKLLNMDACECPHTGCVHEMRLIARAQVHATLAHTAATLAHMMHTADAWSPERVEWQAAMTPP